MPPYSDVPGRVAFKTYILIYNIGYTSFLGVENIVKYEQTRTKRKAINGIQRGDH